MEISIKRKDNYGTSMIYVCEEIPRKWITQLTGKKTVSEKDIDALKALGVQVRDIDVEIEQLIKA